MQNLAFADTVVITDLDEDSPPSGIVIRACGSTVTPGSVVTGPPLARRRGPTALWWVLIACISLVTIATTVAFAVLVR